MVACVRKPACCPGEKAPQPIDARRLPRAFGAFCSTLMRTPGLNCAAGWLVCHVG